MKEKRLNFTQLVNQCKADREYMWYCNEHNLPLGKAICNKSGIVFEVYVDDKDGEFRNFVKGIGNIPIFFSNSDYFVEVKDESSK